MPMYYAYPAEEFQFHKGAIRTQFKTLAIYFLLILFQFHKGAIRTDKLLRLQQQAGKFQFHKGAIRTVVPLIRCFLLIISIP